MAVFHLAMSPLQILPEPARPLQNLRSVSNFSLLEPSSASYDSMAGLIFSSYVDYRSPEKISYSSALT